MREPNVYRKVEVVAWDLSEDDKGSFIASEREVLAELQATFTAPSYRAPMLPAVAMELLSLSSKANVEVDQIVALLEKDVLLAGRVLQVCRSAAYAGAMELRGLKAAVVRLGLRTIRDVVMEVALNLRIFKSPAYSPALEQIHRHSTAVAHLCRVVSRYAPLEADYTFLCGLLHDVGYSAALAALGDVAKSAAPRPLQSVWPVLEVAHERIAAIIAEKWKLPADLSLVIANHHTLSVGGMIHPVAAVVAVADELARELGMGAALPHLQREGDERRLRLATNALRLDEQLLTLVRKDAQAALNALRAA